MPIRLVDSKPLLIWTTALVVGCILVAAFFNWMLVPYGFLSKDIVTIVVLTFPFGSILASRIAFDMNRHR